ncbi:MAG: hypothetical protein AABX73_00655 [Nanoarchaeota archaeon]
MNLREFAKALNGDGVEGELIKTMLYSLITSFILLGAFYYLKLKKIDNFIPDYGFYLVFAALSYALLVPTIRQVRAYKQFSCMSGMMIGMTAGMMAGFLAGFYAGATNGMFVGGIFGMGAGILLGVWLGSCCGVMGFMEGMMAGFMGGLMGAMTSVMMLNDNVKIATVIMFIVTSIILISLNYMIYLETRENERQRKEEHLITLIITFILTLATTWLMVFGPRSALFG